MLNNKNQNLSFCLGKCALEQNKIFNPKRLSFFAAGGSPEVASKRPEDKPELKPEEIEERLKPDGVAFIWKNPEKNLQSLVDKVYPKKEYAESQRKIFGEKLKNDIDEALGKFTENHSTTSGSWKGLWETPFLKDKNCTRVTIQDDYIKFLDGNSQEITIGPSDIEQNREVRIGIPIDKNQKSYREFSQEAAKFEKDQKAQQDATKKAETSQQDTVEGGSRSGKLNSSALAKKITELYSDAKDGDKVNITHAGKTRVAEFNNNEWHYKDEKGNWDTVKIMPNDSMGYTPFSKPDAAAQGPRTPENIGNLGYLRLDRKASWKEIARTFMCMGQLPNNGQTYEAKTEKLESPAPGSPQAVLEKLGFSADNPSDVAEYAKLLAQANKNEKVFVWIVNPTAESQRVQTEGQVKAKDEQTKEKADRSGKKAKKDQQEEYALINKHFHKLLGLNDEDNDYVFDKEKMVKIIDNDDLWNLYWGGLFKGKEMVVKGFVEYWNIDKNQIRTKLHEAITGTGIFAMFNSNEKVNLGDLLGAFGVYTTLDGKKSGSISTFTEELKFFEIKEKLENGKQVVVEQDLTWYNDNREDYEKKPGFEGRSYGYYVNILKGASFIMEGLKNLDTKIPVEEAEAKLEADKKEKESYLEEPQNILQDMGLQERKLKGGRTRLDREPLDRKDYARYFLQKLFHPQNTQSIEDMTGKQEAKEDRAQNLTTEGNIYSIIEHNASKEAGKINPETLMNELNVYIRYAMLDYLRAKNENNQEKVKDLEQKYGLPSDPSLTGNLNQLMTLVKVKDINYYNNASPGIVDHLRSMVTDGFVSSEAVSNGKVERAGEMKDWQTLDEIRNNKDQSQEVKSEAERVEKWQKFNESLEKDDNELTGIALRKFYSEHPDLFAKSSDQEIQEKVVAADQAITVKSKELFQLGVGVNRAGVDEHGNHTTDVRISVGTTFDLGGGFTFGAGIGINARNGQPFIGVSISKELVFNENLKADIGTSTGWEPGKGRLFAGAGGDFSFIVPVSDKYNLEYGPDAGAGVSGSYLNPAENYFGPYVGIHAGIKRDDQRNFDTSLQAKKESRGYNVVENAKDTESKATAIKNLPKIGPLMFEMQNNLNWTNEQLVTFYEKYLKPGIEEITAKEVAEDAKGSLTKLGVTGTLSWGIAIEAAIVAGAYMFGGPAAAALVVIGLHLQVGIGTGGTVYLNISEKQNDQQALNKADLEMLASMEKIYPGVKFQPAGLSKLETKNAIISKEFVGEGDLQFVINKGTGERTPIRNVESDTLEPKANARFEEKQKEFAGHHLKLGKEAIKDGVMMYTIEPTEVQEYQMFIDPFMKENHGLIYKEGKIFVATSENLDQLHIRRFDAFSVGQEEGANKHTIITISDNPARTMGEIARASEYYIYADIDDKTMQAGEAKWDKNPSVSSERKITQFNCNSYANLEFDGTLGNFLNATAPSKQRAESQLDMQQKEADQRLTNEALSVQKKEFNKETDIDQIQPTPKEFMAKNFYLYRDLTTYNRANTQLNRKTLYEKIKTECTDGEKAPTPEQILLYSERLYQISMAESKGSSEEQVIENRLKWAEKEIFTPLFAEGLEKLSPPAPENMSADALAKAFIGAIRTNLKNPDGTPKEGEKLYAGMAILTAVGTGGKNYQGIREIARQTGLTQEDNQIRPGYNYSEALTSKDSRFAEQHTIARILLDRFNEIPKKGENKDFLQSRLAEKLFFLGDASSPNPLMHFLSENDQQSQEHYKNILNAYKNLDTNLEVSPYSEAIEALRKICEQVKQAQLGEIGSPLILDGVPTRAIYLNGYYLLVQTRLKNGIYNFCKNPSAVYNERLLVIKPKGGQRIKELGTVASAAQNKGLEATTPSVETTSIGLNANFTTLVQSSPPPPRLPHTHTHDRTPAKPTPAPSNEGSVAVKMPGGANPSEAPINMPSTPKLSGGATPDDI